MARKRGRLVRPAAAVTGPPEGRSWTAWAVPDLSLTAALAGVVFCLFIYHAPWRLFSDSDPGWHILTGERILATGKIPHSDPFSFLQTGHPWYAWEWLSDILMALFHRWQGLTGVVFLFTVCIGLAIWLCFRLHRSLGGDFFPWGHPGVGASRFRAGRDRADPDRGGIGRHRRAAGAAAAEPPTRSGHWVSGIAGAEIGTRVAGPGPARAAVSQRRHHPHVGNQQRRNSAAANGNFL